MRAAVFLSASIPTGKKKYEGSDRHFETARPQWIRDAVLAVARAAFAANFDLVFGAHPSISPMVLMVAREFPLLTPPRVTVYQSLYFAGQIPSETLELADGHLGILEEAPVMMFTSGEPNLAASLALMRSSMFERPGLVAGVLVGGMDGIVAEANLFKQMNSKLPMYAIASAGGAAADLLATPPQQTTNFSPADFSGHPFAPVSEDVLREERVGYTRVASEVIEALRAAMMHNSLQPRP